MSEDIKDTLKQRGSRYGAFKDNARISQSLQAGWEESEGYILLQSAPLEIKDTVNEGLKAIFQKLARIFNGDPLYADNFRDIGGYAMLVTEELVKHEEGKSLMQMKQHLAEG